VVLRLFLQKKLRIRRGESAAAHSASLPVFLIRVESLVERASRAARE
jgi:hypothetical protein